MRTTATNPLLEAALGYAARGWKVVPLHPREKRPRPRDWPAAASDDAGVVGRWWREVPAGNVGVALGSGSGLVAVDVDTDEGSRLLAGMAAGELPATCEMTTGKGSRLLYAIPDGLEVEPRTGVIKGADGSEALRFQGRGGQCVMPPSVHPSGRVYAWVEGRSPGDVPAAPMPGWLLVEMTRPEQPQWVDPPTSGPADSYAPGADFNRRGSWEEVLGAAGYRPAGRRGEVRYFTRPGKAAGVSVTLGHYRAKDGTPALYAFSGSIPQLQAGKCYDLFGFVARVSHGGDFGAAARALSLQGYGKPAPDRNGHHADGHRPAGKPAGPGEAPPAPEPWDDPVPLDTGLKVTAFPLAALPGDLAALAGTVGAATNSPPDYVAAAALAIAAGVLGAARALDVKDRYAEISSLYVGVIAPKGSGKTPAMAYLMPPLVAEQTRRRREGDQARAFVENVTTSKLANQLRDSPRGLLMIRDELSALFAGFNEFKARGQGSDRQFYLSCWSGAPVTKDRVDPDSDDVFVPHPRLSIVGGIQPRVLSRFTADSDDGLFDRFLWSYPDPLPMAPENGLTVPAALTDAWSAGVSRLWAMRMVPDGDGGDRPFFLRLARPAWEVWVEWTRWLSDATRADDFPEDLRGPAAKLRGYAARLALVSHALAEAYGESAATTVLGAEDMGRGVELARYFFAHARRVWSAAGRDDRSARAKRILAWVKGWGQPTFTRRDLWRGLRKSFAEIEDTIRPLRWLVQLGYLRYAGEPPGRGGRGVPTTVYEVNPSLSGDR